MENMKDLIYECNMQNIQFQSGIGGSYYTIQNLIHSGSPSLINSLYESYATKLEKVSTKSLVKKSDEAGQLKLMLNTLEALYEYKNAEIAKKRNATIARKEKERELAILQEVEIKKAYESAEGKSEKDVKSRIAQLQEELRV
jgi:hypothetical protein